MTLPRGGFGSTSLGAVGGPRGVAAGGLRVLIEFITQYNPAAIKQLEADLVGLDATESRLSNRQIRDAEKLVQVEAKQAKLQQIVAAAAKQRGGKTGAAVLKEFKAIETGLEGSARQRTKALASLRAFTAAQVKAGNLTRAEAALVGQLASLENKRVATARRLSSVESDRLGVLEQQQAVQGRLSQFSALKSGLGQRLGGLAIGAVGGLVGGAIVGVGFAAAQALIDAVGEKLQDLIDPARHAREALVDFGDAVDQLAEARGIQQIEAIQKVLASVGITADKKTAGLLSEALLQQKINEALALRTKYDDIIAHNAELRKQALEEEIKILIAEARLRGDKVETFGGIRGTPQETRINGVNVLKLAEEDLLRVENALGLGAKEDIALKNQQAAATYGLALALENVTAAANAYSDTQIAAKDAAIAALGTGESDKTRAIQAQIERLQGGGGSSNKQALANIAEERAIILLRMKLRLMGTNINLEQYEGKFLLEAINMKLAAMQKEAAAQDRLNKLLDIQFRISKGIHRNQGETINDFLERRAQENRQILSDQRDIERQTLEASLNDLKDKTEDEVKLKELAEQKKTLLAQAGASARLKSLQKELKASEQADADALKAKIAAIEAEKAKIKEAEDKALFWSSEENRLELSNYIKLQSTIAGLAALSGRIRGLEMAKEFLTAIMLSGLVTGPQLRAIASALSGITSLLKQYDYRMNLLSLGSTTASFISKMGNVGAAKGGVFPLNNSMSPFGSNVRVGEQGTELGVVLSNRVTQALKDSQQTGMGDMNFYGVPVDDMYSWGYKIKNIVKETIREELRG